MTDDLLTTFRSEMPMPDEETTQRIYEQSTSGRRRLVTRNRLVTVAAVLALAGIAGGLSATLGGGGSKHPVAGGPNRPGGFMKLMPLSVTPNRDGETLSSIDVTVNGARYANATLTLQVLYSNASPSSYPTSADPRSVVFEETVPMTNSGAPGTSTGGPGVDVSVSHWSGTLSPSDWNGGCQLGLYRIRTAIYASGASVADPFGSADSELYHSGWFPGCGPGTGPTGSSGPTGGNGPTG